LTSRNPSATLLVMQIATTEAELTAAMATDTGTCSFVPTMGALHEGHLSLIRTARGQSRPVVVSIFVNPTQFGPNEDYQRYPRTFDADVQAADEAGAEVIFAPDVETVYPGYSQGSVSVFTPELPAVACEPKLEDAHRPGHFAGVCQVVARLFDLVQPGIAVFGEKDYQQLLVIQAMVASYQQRWPSLQILPHPTLRESDGLAMSSRNRYLSSSQRDRALGLSKALHAAAMQKDAATAEHTLNEVLTAHHVEIDYAVVRDADTLNPVTPATTSMRMVIAARVDDIRLIDNAPFEPVGA
jgi:pantoate--beta-alanine ligase